MKLNDLKKNISKIDKTKISRLEVRELEESSNGEFIAFVDEKDVSYDVKIILDKDNIVFHHCNCDSTSAFCIHKKSVILQMTNPTQSKVAMSVKKLKRKKINSLEELINEQDKESLQAWLFTFLSKNKDANIEFMLHFGNKPIHYTPENVNKIIDEIFKSVISSRRLNITADNIKRIVDLLTTSIKPIEDFLLSNIYTDNGYQVFEAIFSKLQYYQWAIDTNSKRLNKFIEELAERNIAMILQIKDLDAWKNILIRLFKNYFNPQLGRSFAEREFAIKIYIKSNNDQKSKIAEIVSDLITENDYNSELFPKTISYNILVITVNHGFFQNIYKRFIPIPNYHAYNLFLIKEVLKLDGTLAIKYINESIKSTYNGYENYEYYLLLEKIYSEKEDEIKLSDIRNKLFFLNPSLFRYVQIIEEVKDHNSILVFKNKVRKELSHYSHAKALVEIYGYEKDWKRLTETLRYDVQIEDFWQYKKHIHEYNKNILLTSILKDGRKIDYLFYPDQPDFRNDIIDFVKNNYNYKTFYDLYKTMYSSVESFNYKLYLSYKGTV